MRLVILAVLLSGCVTSRFVARDENFEPAELKEHPALEAGRNVPRDAKLLGRIEVFHNNLTGRDAIIRVARSRAKDTGCTWIVHANPNGNADVKTEGVEFVLVFGGSPGPPQAEGENRADFYCFTSR